MTLTPYFVAWAVLAIAVLGLALTRYLVSFREDDNIHLSEGEKGLIIEQMTIFGKLKAIDRWGKALTILEAITGLTLVGIYLYQRIP